MDQTPNDPLFKALMGDCKDVTEALNRASQRIAEIGRRHIVRRTITKDGCSRTELYDIPNDFLNRKP